MLLRLGDRLCGRLVIGLLGGSLIVAGQVVAAACCRFAVVSPEDAVESAAFLGRAFIVIRPIGRRCCAVMLT